MIKPALGALAAILGGTVLLAAATIGAAGQLLGNSLTADTAPSTTALADIPPTYLALYREAATTCPGLSWTVLAGIGKVETDHGRSPLPGVHTGANSAGAEGPMQFLPATFAEYATPVPAGGANPPTPYDPTDAIYATARMLCADGARNNRNLNAAIYAYNHATSYVADVLATAATYASPTTTPPATPGSRWTPELGRQVAARALQWLGWPYSYAAGNTHGPTYGIAVDHDSRNDAHVLGFDCSGLTLYALAPWRTLAHDAATQYTQAGTQHPNPEQLQPGDLVFWSDNDTTPGIGHVAIYLGQHHVIQAPHSGATITITNLDNVEPGYYAATRPLT